MLDDSVVSVQWQLSDELWERLEPLLPTRVSHPKGGRPHVDRRKVADAIFYILRTGIQWQALPKAFCPGSTAHDHFQQWRRAGVFRRFWELGLAEYDQIEGLDWNWLAMDGAMTKVPLGGKGTGPNPWLKVRFQPTIVPS